MAKGHPEEEIEGQPEVLTPDFGKHNYWRVNTGYFPIDRRAMELMKLRRCMRIPHFRTAIDQLEASQVTPATQGAVIGVFPEARQAVEVAIEQVVLGLATPQEALDEAAAK